MTSQSEHPQSLFRPEPGTIYLDAATYGLPPTPTVEVLSVALERWQSGVADWVEEWDREGEAARTLFATLIGVQSEEIGLVPTVSVGVGTIAASLPEGTRVLVPEQEFTSLLYPLLVARDQRGIEVTEVPFERLLDGMAPGVDLVAFSLSRSQDGATAPLGAIVERALEIGARLLVDTTHATPFIDIREHAPAIDYLVCHGYKHLLCPRGAGFLRVRRDRIEDIAPYNANWRSALPLYQRNYGSPLGIAGSAARFDVSLAWHAWAGARQSLELLVGWQADGTLGEPVRLAARLAAGVGAPPPAGTIVGITVPDADAATAALAAAGIRCAARGGRVRLSTHVYNTDDEIDRTIETLRRLLDDRR